MMVSPLRLGLNVDHVATLRNARGGDLPDPLLLAKQGLAAGAHSITVHLREDRRHIRDDDVARMKAELDAPLNLEMAVTEEMLGIALKTAPRAACLVPEKREERTTEGGLNLDHNKDLLRRIISELQALGTRVSLFVEPDVDVVGEAYRLGARAVELHTGTFADAVKAGHAETALTHWAALKEAAHVAHHLGLEVHAGHGLDEESAFALARIPVVVELNIGHHLIARSLDVGLSQAVKTMLEAMHNGRQAGLLA